jgi:hypothetical protein
MERRTTVDIEGDAFLINARPTYPGRTFNWMKIEGLLLNSRMVEGLFDDVNPETRSLWDYPDGPWDAERNTREFIAAMPAWRAHGMLAFGVNIQGGCPRGYAEAQPWINPGYQADGALRADYMSRAERICDAADELGMVVILGLFYFGQDQHLTDEPAVIRATDAVADWLCEKGCTNVIVEINNECDVPKYEHEILRPHRVHELIERVQQRSAGKVNSPAGRLLVGTSMQGGSIPPANIASAGDLLLVHGNGQHDPAGIAAMCAACRKLPSYKGQPVVFNEDDHFDFDKPANNFLAAVAGYASWGYFDYRFEGEGFEQGYQSLPCDWGIGSDRKRGFFGLLAEITGNGPGSQ